MEKLFDLADIDQGGIGGINIEDKCAQFSPACRSKGFQGRTDAPFIAHLLDDLSDIAKARHGIIQLGDKERWIQTPFLGKVSQDQVQRFRIILDALADILEPP